MTVFDDSSIAAKPRGEDNDFSVPIHCKTPPARDDLDAASASGYRTSSPLSFLSDDDSDAKPPPVPQRKETLQGSGRLVSFGSNAPFESISESRSIGDDQSMTRDTVSVSSSVMTSKRSNKSKSKVSFANPSPGMDIRASDVVLGFRKIDDEEAMDSLSRKSRIAKLRNRFQYPEAVTAVDQEKELPHLANEHETKEKASNDLEYTICRLESTSSLKEMKQVEQHGSMNLMCPPSNLQPPSAAAEDAMEKSLPNDQSFEESSIQPVSNPVPLREYLKNQSTACRDDYEVSALGEESVVSSAKTEKASNASKPSSQKILTVSDVFQESGTMLYDDIDEKLSPWTLMSKSAIPDHSKIALTSAHLDSNCLPRHQVHNVSLGIETGSTKHLLHSAPVVAPRDIESTVQSHEWKMMYGTAPDNGELGYQRPLESSIHFLDQDEEMKKSTEVVANHHQEVGVNPGAFQLASGMEEQDGVDSKCKLFHSWQGKLGAACIVGSLLLICGIIAIAVKINQGSAAANVAPPTAAPIALVSTLPPTPPPAESIACSFLALSMDVCLETTSAYGSKSNTTIPTELGLLTSLDYLNLSDNQLTGTIPSEMGAMTRLTSLSLSYNQLTGTIPSEMGAMTNLISFFLSYNRLTGTIPSELSNLNASRIDLYNNSFSGTISTELCQSALNIVIDCADIECNCCYSSNRFDGSFGVNPSAGSFGVNPSAGSFGVNQRCN